MLGREVLKYLMSGIICSASLYVSVAGAQALPDLKQGVPGYRPGQENNALPPSLPAKAAPDIKVPRGSGQVVPAEASKIPVVLVGVHFEGGTVFSENELAEIYNPLIGQNRTLADIYKIAADITAKYRENGFILSRAVIPAQNVSDGRFKIQLIEGYIDAIDLQTENKLASYVADKVRANLAPVLQQRPLNIKTLERCLLLANDSAGVTVKTVVKPSPDHFGASSLSAILSFQPFSASAAIDNHGSKYTGHLIKSASASVNSLAGWGDKLTVSDVSATPANQFHFQQLSYIPQIGHNGLAVNFTVEHATSTPVWLLGPYNVLTSTVAQSVAVGYPILRSRTQNLVVEGGIHNKIVDTDVLKTRFTKDRSNSVFGRLGYDRPDDGLGGHNAATLSLYRGGIPWTKTSDQDPYSSRPEAKRNWNKYTLEFSRVQNLGVDGLSLTLAGIGQWTRSKLPSSEEISFGGVSYGRGYNMGEIAGSQGIGGKSELTYRAIAEKDWMQSLDIYGFFDSARVWSLNISDRNTTRESRVLSSTGIGARAALQSWASLDFEIAKPLSLIPSDNQYKSGDDAKSLRYLMSLRVNY